MIILTIEEEERQMLVLALAELALSRPGWDDSIREIAVKLDRPGTPMYEGFKVTSADRVKAERTSLVKAQSPVVDALALAEALIRSGYVTQLNDNTAGYVADVIKEFLTENAK